MKETSRIGIFGHYGNKNLGDEAIILAVIQNLKERIPDVEISCFSINPEDSTARYGVPAYPIRKVKKATVASNQPSGSTDSLVCATEMITDKNRSTPSRIKEVLKKLPFVFTTLKFIKNILEFPFLLFEELCFLKKSFQSLKEVDLLLITGSNQFLDNFGGSWGFPYTLLKWSVLARLAGKKIAHISIGAGPLDKILSKSFICGSVCLSHYLSFRDKGSSDLTKRFLGFKSSHVFPDLAHSLRWEQDVKKQLKRGTTERLVVGINPMPIYDKRYWHIADDAKYIDFVAKIGGFATFLVEKDFNVILFGTHPKDIEVSNDVISYLSQRMDSALLSRCSIKSAEQVPDVMALISSFDFVVATRFHGVLLSLLARKCVVALCYGAKTNELMIEADQGQYALDFESFSLEELKSIFLKLFQNREDQELFIKKKEQDFIAKLDDQYKLILQLL